jgi:hypothetical protein
MFNKIHFHRPSVEWPSTLVFLNKSPLFKALWTKWRKLGVVGVIFHFYSRNNFILGRDNKLMMEKQKLAEMVMQKMKQKKELEERNRPHYEVLRLEATFAQELNADLKDSIAHLEGLLAKERTRL